MEIIQQNIILLFGVEKAWTQVHNLNQLSENLCPIFQFYVSSQGSSQEEGLVLHGSILGTDCM